MDTDGWHDLADGANNDAVLFPMTDSQLVLDWIAAESDPETQSNLAVGCTKDCRAY